MKYLLSCLVLFSTFSFTTAQTNYSLSFDGVDDQLDIPMTNAKSMAFWVKVSSNNVSDGGDSYILDARPGLANSWLEPYGTIGSGWNKIYMNGIEIIDYNDTSIVKDSWIFLYMEAISSFSETITFMGPEGGPDAGWPPRMFLEGKMDELAIWNQSLTDSEITALYNSGLGLSALSNFGEYLSANSLLGIWDFNDGEGSTLTDQSGNGNDGTIYGGTWSDDGAPIDPPPSWIEEPTILDIRDIPEDNGGKVFIDFSKSYWDQDTIMNRNVEIYTIEMLENDNWVSLHSISAYGRDVYTTVAITLEDSTSVVNGLTTYRVIASMEEGIFVSAPQSGYSIDNIAPQVPTGVMLMANDDGLNISWDAIQDDDLSYYIIDKSAEELFQTDQYSSFFTTELFFNDYEYENGDLFYYRISAVDHSGNIGPHSPVVSTHALSIDNELIPNVYALHQNYPNPFNPTTKISYDLPKASVVSLSIYDLMGREVRTMINSEQTAGFKNIQWNAIDNLGKSVPAGMYIYTIQAGEFRQTRKMVLLK